MKIFAIIIAIITGLLLFSTTMCGVWIRAHHITAASSLDFHMQIGLLTTVFGMVSVVLLIVLAVKR